MIRPSLSALLLSDGYFWIPSSTSIRSISCSCQTPCLPPLSMMLSMDDHLHWIGAPQSLTVLLGLDFVLLSFIPLFSVTIITPLGHPAFYIGHSSCPDGAPLLPENSAFCLGNSFLTHCNLTSYIQHFTYPKLSHLTLEFNIAHGPGLNHLQIQGTPPTSLHHWWIVSSCICRPWWDGRLSG